MPNPMKELRAAAGLTQEACAARAGMRPNAWCKLENKPSLEATELSSLRRIAKALGVKVEWLLRF